MRRDAQSAPQNATSVFGDPAEQDSQEGARAETPQSRTDGGRENDGASIKKNNKEKYDKRKENSTHIKSKMDGLQRSSHTNAYTRHRK